MEYDIDTILEKKQLESKDAYYAGVGFKDTERVKKVFYSGDLLLKNQKEISDKEFTELAEDFFDTPEQDFFDSLDMAIHKVVGENNCHRVGGGFGQNEFHISYHFRKSIFWEIIDKLAAYFEYIGLDDIADFYDNTKGDKGKWILFKEYITNPSIYR